MSDNENLITSKQKELLLEYLDAHLKDSGFFDQIQKKIDSLNLDENTNIEKVYNELHQFMTANMPQEVQDAFFTDIKRVTSKKN